MFEKPLELKSKYSPSPDQEKAIQKLVDQIEQNDSKKQVLLGVTGSGKTFVMANVIQRTQRPALILSHNKTLAAQLFEEFKDFFPENAVKYFVSYYDYYQPEAYLPGRDVYIEKESEVNQEIERFRLSAMNAAVTRRDTVVVASVSCIYNIGDPRNYENKAIELKVGQSFPISSLALELVTMQYQRDLTDFVPGSFRIKGDVVDLFMPYSDFPIRIEYFGDEIERITYIDPLTAKRIPTEKEIVKMEVFPSRNFVFDKETIKVAVEKMRNDLKARVDELNKVGKIVEAQRLNQRTNFDIEMLEQIGYCKGMENYSAYFEGRPQGSPPFTLLDYFPRDYLLFVDESHITLPQVGGMSNGDRARKETLIEYGFRLPSALDNRPLNFDEFRERQGYSVYVSATPNEWEVKDSNKNITELLTRPTGLLDPEVSVRPTKNQIDDVIEEVKKTIAKKQRVIITTLTKKMAEDLSAYLLDLGIKVNYLHSDIDTVERVDILRDLRLGEYDVLVGINLLREGIDLPEVSLVIILDADKEGFLRSRSTLIQIIGRAARHVEGRVIMYADNMTGSMKAAIEETERRREYQVDYNKKNNITPTTIVKAIRDRLIDRDVEAANDAKDGADYLDWIDEAKPTKEKIKRLIKDLEDKMFVAAENLQFEKAAKIRDDIRELKTKLK